VQTFDAGVQVTACDNMSAGHYAGLHPRSLAVFKMPSASLHKEVTLDLLQHIAANLSTSKALHSIRDNKALVVSAKHLALSLAASSGQCQMASTSALHSN